MFSNLIKLSLISFFLLSSCGLKIGEKPVKETVVEIKSTACLDSSIDQINLMFKAQARDEDIAPALNCISKTLHDFTTTVQGENKTYFTTDEVTYFLNKNFLKNNKKIPDSLASEIMKLKVSFLGGTDGKLTKLELIRLREVIDNTTEDIVRINKYMPILTNHWNYAVLTAAEKEQNFKIAAKATEELFDKVFNQFTKRHTEYNINSALDLVKEFLKYNNSSIDQINNIESYRPLVLAIKNHLISNGPILKSSDWMGVSKSLSATFFLILRNDYFTKSYNQDFGIPADNKVSKYGTLIQDIAEDVAAVLALQENKVLTYEQMVELYNVSFKTFDVDMTFSVNVVRDFTLLKNALVNNTSGVDANSWNKNDFKALVSKMDGLFVQFGILTNIIDQMDKDKTWKTDYAQFNNFEKSFSKSGDDLIQLFQGQYDLDNIKSLLGSLKEANIIESDDIVSKYDKYYLTITQFKKLITSTDGTNLNTNEIKNILGLAKNGYFHYLEFDAYLKGKKFKDRAFAGAAVNMLPKVKQTLENSLNLNPTQHLSTDNIIKAYEAYRIDFEKKAVLTDDSLRIVLTTLWSHLLINPEHRLNGFILAGFNKEALNNLINDAQYLLQSNALANGLIADGTPLTQADLLTNVRQQIANATVASDKALLEEIELAVSGPVPLTTQNSYLKILDPNTNQYQLADIQLSNIGRTISRLLIQAYSVSIDNINKLDQTSVRHESVLNLTELQFTFQQIRSVLVELDVINPTNEKFMTKRFQEADLFVSRSNGDDLASFMEIHDIALHMISGTVRSNKIHDNIYTHCLTPAALPLNRYTEVSETCLLDTYHLFNEGFEFLPPFLQLKTDMGEALYKDYSLKLLVAAGYIANDKQIILLDDADNFPHIVQYIEMMFAQFDADRSGDLNKDEALTAFPTYKNLIRTVVKSMDGGDKIKEDQLPGVFIYFLKNGRGPKNVVEKLQFMAFINNDKKWIVNATRYDIGVVFQFLAQSP